MKRLAQAHPWIVFYLILFGGLTANTLWTLWALR